MRSSRAPPAALESDGEVPNGALDADENRVSNTSRADLHLVDGGAACDLFCAQEVERTGGGDGQPKPCSQVGRV